MSLMRLEDIINKLEQSLSRRFIKNETKYQTLSSEAESLPQNKRLNKDELHQLDLMSLDLKKRARRYDNPDLERTIERIDKLREPYRKQAGLETYDILTQKGSRYDKRFESIKEYTSNNTVGFDDLMLTLDYLKTNRYLKKKSERDHDFRRQKEALERTLTDKLLNHRARRSVYRVPIASKFILGSSAAMCLLASLPTQAYTLLN